MAWNQTPFNYNGTSPTQIKDDLEKANENFSILTSIFKNNDPTTLTVKNSEKLLNYTASIQPSPNSIPVSTNEGMIDINWVLKISQDLTINNNTVIWDLKKGANAFLTLTSNVTIDAINQIKGMTYNIVIKQDSTGNRTVTFSNVFKIQNGQPQIDTSPNKVTIMSFISDGIYLYGTSIKGF